MSYGATTRAATAASAGRLEPSPLATIRGAGDDVSAEPSEYVLVGGGLQNCLIALALLAERPATRLTLIERAERLGGNHTWCFHEGSAPAQARPWLDRLLERRWPAHDVHFPGHGRRIEEEYCAITSERLNREVSAALSSAPHARRVTGTVRSLEASSVTLDDGRRIAGELVVDARGPEHGSAPGAALGYQKFLGIELEVEPGSAPPLPILMDATVEQLDGFRFMYLLPLSPTRVLLEDTYYSDSSALDPALSRQRILAYAEARGIVVRRELRVERGVLPIPLSFESRAARSSPLRAGYGGGLFHPTTGYSFPVALRFALHVARFPAAEAAGAEYERMVAAHHRQVRFCVALNRLLFRAFAPEARRSVLERFYRLPAATIRRFYALETTSADRLRILCGRPPAGFSLSRLIAGEIEP